MYPLHFLFLFMLLASEKRALKKNSCDFYLEDRSANTSVLCLFLYNGMILVTAVDKVYTAIAN